MHRGPPQGTARARLTGSTDVSVGGSAGENGFVVRLGLRGGVADVDGRVGGDSLAGALARACGRAYHSGVLDGLRDVVADVGAEGPSRACFRRIDRPGGPLRGPPGARLTSVEAHAAAGMAR